MRWILYCAVLCTVISTAVCDRPDDRCSPNPGSNNFSRDKFLVEWNSDCVDDLGKMWRKWSEILGCRIRSKITGNLPWDFHELISIPSLGRRRSRPFSFLRGVFVKHTENPRNFNNRNQRSRMRSIAWSFLAYYLDAFQYTLQPIDVKCGMMCRRRLAQIIRNPRQKKMIVTPLLATNVDIFEVVGLKSSLQAAFRCRRNESLKECLQNFKMGNVCSFNDHINSISKTLANDSTWVHAVNTWFLEVMSAQAFRCIKNISTDDMYEFASNDSRRRPRRPRRQYYLRNINAFRAFRLLRYNPNDYSKIRSSRNVNIALLDTGCSRHETLNTCDKMGDALWTISSRDSPYSRGRHGWNFWGDDEDWEDTVGHGTAMASLMVARGRPRARMYGVDWTADIGCLKIGNEMTSVSALAEALHYALINDFNIVYTSAYGPENAALKSVFKSLDNEGIITVVAAGNQGCRIETSVQDGCGAAPASFKYDCNRVFLEHMISVIAVRRDGSKWPASSFGRQAVIAAPGVDIFAATVGSSDAYTTVNGTSAAAALVTGVASSVLSFNRFVRPRKWRRDRRREAFKVYDAIVETGRFLPNLCNGTRNNTMVDYFEALRYYLGRRRSGSTSETECSESSDSESEESCSSDSDGNGCGRRCDSDGNGYGRRCDSDGNGYGRRCDSDRCGDDRRGDDRRGDERPYHPEFFALEARADDTPFDAEFAPAERLVDEMPPRPFTSGDIRASEPGVFDVSDMSSLPARVENYSTIEERKQPRYHFMFRDGDGGNSTSDSDADAVPSFSKMKINEGRGLLYNGHTSSDNDSCDW